MNPNSEFLPKFYRCFLSAAMLFLVLAVAAAGSLAQTPGKADEAKAKAEFKQLLELKNKLESIPREDYEKQPNRRFFKANESKIVYHEPGAMYYVRSELFWDLEKKYRGLPVADDIAWEAAQNPLPGECEGYLNCGLYVTRITLGEYLSRYPDGRHSAAAVLQLKENFASIADEAKSPASYTPPEDTSEKAEVAKLLGEFEAILQKVEHPDRETVLADIKRIAEAFK